MDSLDKSKVALHVLLFDIDDFMDEFIKNCSPFYTHIYAAFSPQPWGYRTSGVQNSTDINEVRRKYGDVLTIIEGIWDTEEDQRNACVERALEDGYEYLAVQDCDEFYMESEYPGLLREVYSDPETELFSTRVYTFWKSTGYVLARGGRPARDRFPFALNIAKGVRFAKRRETTARVKRQLETICYHLSYARSDDYMHRKISTWGHSHEFDIHAWYERKWLGWRLGKRNLHPVEPTKWHSAIPYQGPLPEAIRDTHFPPVTYARPNPGALASDALLLVQEHLRPVAERLARSVRKRLGLGPGRRA